jgi:hypothetical protein
MREIK